jgi:hypothetical protein
VSDPADGLILIDGPGAGRRVRIDRNWACSYVFTSWPDADRFLLDYDALGNTTFAGPTHTVYRVGHVYNQDRQVVSVGWCSGEPRPDPEQVEYWIRFESPVKVIAAANAWPSGCDFVTREVDATVQGACRCGWKTEAAPKRRAREVAELVNAHYRVGAALAFGKDDGLSGLDFGLLRTHSIGEATRFEALLNRAATVGMSRERAREIFHNAELAAYGFDDAIERLEHRVRLFTMYGYMPVAARDVLAWPWRDIEAQQIDPEMILNKPRWMPDPLGQQFAEMRRDRQRTLVQAAIELIAQLGGDVEGWPLERAVAAVMPCKEDA